MGGSRVGSWRWRGGGEQAEEPEQGSLQLVSECGRESLWTPEGRGDIMADGSEVCDIVRLTAEELVIHREVVSIPKEL